MTTSADNPKKTRGDESTRVFTPARLVPLAHIALAVLGLTYLRFKPDAAPVSVPPDAKAGELIGA